MANDSSGGRIRLRMVEEMLAGCTIDRHGVAFDIPVKSRHCGGQTATPQTPEKTRSGAAGRDHRRVGQLRRGGAVDHAGCGTNGRRPRTSPTLLAARDHKADDPSYSAMHNRKASYIAL
jgi:hypothetical protein